MRENRTIPMDKEQKRMFQITYIMEHWDELPENLQGRFEGIISTTDDFLRGRIGIKPYRSI